MVFLANLALNSTDYSFYKPSHLEFPVSLLLTIFSPFASPSIYLIQFLKVKVPPSSIFGLLLWLLYMLLVSNLFAMAMSKTFHSSRSLCQMSTCPSQSTGCWIPLPALPVETQIPLTPKLPSLTSIFLKFITTILYPESRIFSRTGGSTQLSEDMPQLTNLFFI